MFLNTACDTTSSLSNVTGTVAERNTENTVLPARNVGSSTSLEADLWQVKRVTLCQSEESFRRQEKNASVPTSAAVISLGVRCFYDKGHTKTGRAQAPLGASRVRPAQH